MNLFAKLFDHNERDVNRYRKIVDKINGLEPQFKKLTDEELKNKTAEFRERLAKSVSADDEYATNKDRIDAYNKALDMILPEAFAACREAAVRTLGMRHFDVQLIGGMVQHDGRISELKTGEGKTLMSTLGDLPQRASPGKRRSSGHRERLSWSSAMPSGWGSSVPRARH